MTSLKPRRRTGEPRPTIFVDSAGITCVRVPLANTPKTAILREVDYARLKAAGLSSFWDLNGNGTGNFYVRAKRPGFGKLMVARLVLQANEMGTVVRYANGDRLDLRLSNLYVASNPYSEVSAAA